nr:hypothetical protein HUO10_003790 [Paraburkholderia busanensis]
MPGIFNLKHDLPPSILRSQINLHEIGKNITPNLTTKTNLKKPLNRSNTNRPPIALKRMSPIPIPHIRRDLFTPPQPVSQTGSNQQGRQDGNPNRHPHPKSRAQRPKRPHNAINQSAKRSQPHNNRHIEKPAYC